MAGLYGVDESKKIAEQLGSITSTVFRILKGNFFAGLELIGPVNALRSVNLQAFGKEIGELDTWDRQVIEEGFKAKLDIADKALQEKLLQSVELLEQLVELIGTALTIFDSAKDIVARFRKLFAL